MTAINWTNITDLSQLPAAANTASDGGFWVGMLFMIWIILILIMLSYGFEVALLGSSFAALVLGVFLVYAGLIAWQWALVFLAVILIMFLYITFNRTPIK